jgi:hypothetical protein
VIEESGIPDPGGPKKHTGSGSTTLHFKVYIFPLLFPHEEQRNWNNTKKFTLI